MYRGALQRTNGGHHCTLNCTSLYYSNTAPHHSSELQLQDANKCQDPRVSLSLSIVIVPTV
jgi:hypothetical protein